MKITTTKVTMMTITDVPPNVPNCGVLDPIRVITEDYGPGQGRIIVSCYDAAWTAYWGAMGNNTVRQFVMKCDTGYIADNLIRSMETAKGAIRLAYLERIAGAIQAAFRAQQPRITPARAARLERLQHANQLIAVIAEHGRRFFWNSTDKRLALLEIGDRGYIYFVDDYRGTKVYTGEVVGYPHRWRGFSHGGTLRGLVEEMARYVRHGVKIQQKHIAPKCWGYDERAMAATRDAACLLPIVASY